MFVVRSNGFRSAPCGRPRAGRLHRWPRGTVLGLGLLVTAALAVRGQESVAGEPSGIETNLVRSWAGDDVTVVDGLVNVPLGMLAGGTTDAYRFEVAVRDRDGNELFRDSWVRQLSDRAADYVEADASYLLETFRFGLRPGDYEIDVRAYPTDAADLGYRETIAIEAFGARPQASDLFLSTRVEPLDESGGGSWSVSRGGFGISAAARTVVFADDPGVYYYIELYGGDEEESAVTVTAEIRDPSGRSLFRTPAEELSVPVGGRSFTGLLPLTGLPVGTYDFVMTVDGGSAGTVTRIAPFAYRRAESIPVAAAAGRSDLEEYFASLSDAELDDTFGGVGVLVTQAERETYEALPPDAKRRYLVDFFGERDLDAAPGNDFLDEYLERIATITARYGERMGTAQRLPWTTDMGRLYLRLGEPQDRVVNYSPSDMGDPAALVGAGSFGGEPPYEIWQYQDTGYVYLFIQENRFDAWRMIFTTDPNMTSLADWPRRIGGECARDLTTYFGIVPSG